MLLKATLAMLINLPCAVLWMQPFPNLKTAVNSTCKLYIYIYYGIKGNFKMQDKVLNICLQQSYHRVFANQHANCYVEVMDKTIHIAGYYVDAL